MGWGCWTLIKGGHKARETHTHAFELYSGRVLPWTGSCLWIESAQGFPLATSNISFINVHILMPSFLKWLYECLNIQASGKKVRIAQLSDGAIREIIGNFTSSKWNNGFVDLDRQSSSFQLGMQSLTRQTKGTSWEETEAWETGWKALKGTRPPVSMLSTAELIRWGVWWGLIAG